MLDNYVAQYKPSMLVYIYPLYFQSYNEVRNFPKAMDSVDKLLSLGDLADVGLRRCGKPTLDHELRNFSQLAGDFRLHAHAEGTVASFNLLRVLHGLYLHCPVRLPQANI